jgi:hypothetical protein
LAAWNQAFAPFPYIRYDEFLNAIRTLASIGTSTYKSFDQGTFEVFAGPRSVSRSKPVVTDGVSSLNPTLYVSTALRFSSKVIVQPRCGRL